MISAYLSRARPLGAPLLFAAVLGIAAYLRLGSLDMVLFGHDEAEWSSVALRIARGEEFPLVGITSLVGVATGPIFLYILALPMLVSSDPAFVTGFIGLLNVVGVGLTFAFVRRYFGLFAAAVASILYATNPWAVYHSRKIWNPDILPLVALVFFWALFLVTVERRHRAFAVAAIACAVAIQLNQSAYVLLPILLVVLISHWRSLVPWPLVLAMAGSLLVSSTYLYHEITHDWAEVSRALAVGSATPTVDAVAAGHVVTLAAGWGFPGEVFGIWTEPGESVPDGLAASVAGTIAFVLGLLVAALRLRGWNQGATGRRQATEALLLLAWVLVPVLAMTRHTFGLEMRYLLLTQPSQFVLAGLGAAALVHGLSRALQRVGTASLPARPLAAAMVALPVLAIGGAQFWQYTTTLAMIERNGLERSYGLPVRYYGQAFASAGRLSEQFPDEPVHVWSAEPATETIRYYAASNRLQIRQASVAHQLTLGPETGRDRLYMLTFTDDPLEERLRRLGFVELADEAIPVPGRQTTIRFYRLPAGTRARAEAELTPGPDLRLTSGFRVKGWQVTQGAQPANAPRITVAWEAWQEPDPGFCLFHNLVDVGGNKLAGGEALIEQTRFVRQGDLLLTWLEVPTPERLELQQGWLSLGMSRCWTDDLAPIVDSSGRTVGQEVRIGPLKVGGPVLSFAAARPRQALGARLGDGIELLGYTLGATTIGRGEPLRVDLYWGARQAIDRDYTVFVQLLHEGTLVAQRDNYPRDGKYPTSLWEPGEAVLDEHSLALPAAAPAGEYRLIAGMYTLDDLTRLPVSTSTGQPLGDVVDLGTILVKD